MISGQDGAYLAKFLLGKSYIVHGSSRDHKNRDFTNLKILGIEKKVDYTLDLKQFNSILYKLKELKLLKYIFRPIICWVIFEVPNETFESIY